MKHRYHGILLVTLAIAASIVSIRLLRADQSAVAPATGSLLELASAMENAVRAGDPVRAEGITAPGVRNDYEWIREWKASGGSSGIWRASIVQWRHGTSDVVRLLQVSRPQVTQSTSDHLYRIASTGSTARLGPEIPESEVVGGRVISHSLDVEFRPADRSVVVQDTATVRRQASHLPFTLLRLNENFVVTSVTRDGRPVAYQRAGGFLILPPPDAEQVRVTFRSASSLPSTGESFAAHDETAITAYWYVHTARLPATATTHITAPAGWRTISNGDLVAESRDGDRWSSTWATAVPLCYLTAAAGKYQETVQRAGPVPIRAWLLGKSEQRATSICRTASNAIAWLRTTFGPYPFKEYIVVESRIFPPALEGYSFTLSGSANLPDVILHEASHTWWGGLVPCTYTSSMWNEAFATYTEWLYERLYRHPSSQDPGHGAVASAASLPSEPPIAKARDAMHPSHAAIGYQKGALVLAQLERLVGTETMLRIMRAFVAEHKRFEAADWAEFAAALNRVAGSGWQGFLGPWLQEPGLPQYSLRSVSARPSGDGYLLEGLIVTSAPARVCLAPLLVETESGEVDHTVVVRRPQTRFSITCPSRPVRVRLDPDGLMLRSPGPDVIVPVPWQSAL